jgi:hypothetical protein
MEQHDRSGRMVAEFLARHKKVKKVFYPGLPNHPQHELAQQQMTGFGSMITFETGSLKNANRLLKKVRVCSLAESLGGVETLISHPATMTHASVPADVRQRIGITDGLIRLSVGIEDLEDLILAVRQDRQMTILMVTHDIDESVYVGDRVIVLTPGPGRVRADMRVDLPAPRDQITTKALPGFVQLRTEVSRLVRGQPGDAGGPGSAGGVGRPAPGDDSRDRNRSRAARASHE